MKMDNLQKAINLTSFGIRMFLGLYILGVVVVSGNAAALFGVFMGVMVAGFMGIGEVMDFFDNWLDRHLLRPHNFRVRPDKHGDGDTLKFEPVKVEVRRGGDHES